MGYEVLDTGGARHEDPSSPETPPEVVAYDALTPVDPQPASNPWSGRLNPWPVTRFGLFPVVSAAVVLLLVGWGVGGSVASRHADRVRAAERASRLAVVATVSSVDTVPGRQVADFTVRLQNAGPLPVSVVLSADDDRATTTTPVVRPLGGAAVVPAGGTLYASLRLGVDCTGPQDVQAALRVPLRTADGVVHRVPVSDDGETASSGVYGGSACSQGFPSIDASVEGTLDHPLLRLSNTTHRALLVRLDLDSSPFVAQTKNFSVLRLKPDLPQVVLAGGSVDLAVTLVPWSCPQGLSVILSSQVSPYIVLVSGFPGTGSLAQDRVGVDLSTLWGVALARTCS
ncbi:hypothetical protein [Angustibacter sp. Root456]|uniref:hypothetical protein n=1 Tax=Angustibacter sp. Root456 TaxID=1736539 RepID=UPI0006F6BC7A|nr:hypothetical protein [Angustibacter sp. Root456]KQX61639.1 hypothetical protein ASD06_13615 [Angustibacter sp. Root456]